MLVFKQQEEEAERQQQQQQVGQEQQAKRQCDDDDSSKFIDCRALNGCNEGPKALGDCQGPAAHTPSAAATAADTKACALTTNKDAHFTKHVAFSDLPQQQQQQQSVKEVSTHHVLLGASGSSSGDNSTELVSPVVVADIKSGRQQQQMMPLTVRTLRRLSMESNCSGSALGTPKKPGSVHGGSHHQGISVTVQAAAKGSGFRRAAVSAAVVSAAADCCSQAIKTPSGAAAAGSNDISVMLAAANSERDYQVRADCSTLIRRPSDCVPGSP